MKALNIGEIVNIQESLQTLVGATWQGVCHKNNRIYIQCYLKGRLFQLNFDFKTPFLCVEELTVKKKMKSEQTPFYLFAKAHGLGNQIESVEVLKELGRVMLLKLSNEVSLEFRLFPMEKNLILRADGKKMALAAFKPLLPVEGKEVDNYSVRSLEQLCEEFYTTSVKKGIGEKLTAEQLRQKEILKKKKVILKIEEDVEKKNKWDWKGFAHFLGSNTHVDLESLSVPSEFMGMLQEGTSILENMDRAFEKVKQVRVKVQNSQERIDQLQQDILALESGQSSGFKVKATAAKNTNLFDVTGAKGRKKNIGGFDAYIGRSAKENIQFLKRSKAWHMWFHLRDVPGAHCILQVPKSAKVLPLKAVAHWLVKETFTQKMKDKDGLKFDLMYSECRHVSPIKGDKLGRVKAPKNQNYTFKFDLEYAKKQ
ncbi:MAG: hypothetical protein HOO06_03905 [Bdellovibrionaceae bacterium]|nr:hypothetical protein [Pseudobdellovibrionaceae bacterium]